MTELVFSIKDIFDDSAQDGCLAQYQSKCYHIPAYQRGYKWGSEPNGAVTILLQDLWHAFEAYQRQEKKEYYLQYITVKKGKMAVKGDLGNCLEVIDGQQRLTTLSILISVLSTLLNKPNLSAGKLHYAIRQDFFSDYIYNSDDLKAFLGKGWQELEAIPAMNKQDIYYLHAAARKADAFLREHQAELPAFEEYLLQYVKLIVNSVEAHIQSETVFKNLNSNKVPLSETELIKALVITKVGRAGSKTERKGFKEVMESRLNLGRLWDEISRWANKPEISTFYFNGSADGMYQLLMLTALCLESTQNKLDTTKESKDLLLFNFYNQYADIGKIYTTIKDVQATLADWHTDTETYNLLGYCRFVKSSGNNSLPFLKDCLNCKTKPALQHFLGTTKADLMPTLKVADLRYGEKGHDTQLHAVLLALSVFVKGVKNAPIRFNFHEFITKSWSLEHIFPQSPEGKEAVLNSDQKVAVKEMLGAGLTENLSQLLDKDKRGEDEKQLYYRALQNESRLNSIGNMCLLTSGDNSSNGCMFFKEKRLNMLRLLQQGSFVPKHTFDVFSKMISQLKSTDLSTWTASDIDDHGKYVSQIISN
jgi:hypothetical protein